MEKLVVQGPTPLKGEVTISGAKNAAVAILPATLLIDGSCTIENLPNISDIKISCEILEKLGGGGDTYNGAARFEKTTKSKVEQMLKKEIQDQEGE